MDNGFLVQHYKLLINEENYMQNGILNMNWRDLGNAVATAVVVAVLEYILKLGNVFSVDVHTIVNSAVMSGIGVILVTLGSTNQGNLVGLFPVSKTKAPKVVPVQPVQ
jgi:hypothetical protein